MGPLKRVPPVYVLLVGENIRGAVPNIETYPLPEMLPVNVPSELSENPNVVSELKVIVLVFKLKAFPINVPWDTIREGILEREEGRIDSVPLPVFVKLERAVVSSEEKEAVFPEDTLIVGYPSKIRDC